MLFLLGSARFSRQDAMNSCRKRAMTTTTTTITHNHNNQSADGLVLPLTTNWIQLNRTATAHLHNFTTSQQLYQQQQVLFCIIPSLFLLLPQPLLYNYSWFHCRIGFSIDHVIVLQFEIRFSPKGLIVIGPRIILPIIQHDPRHETRKEKQKGHYPDPRRQVR